MDNAEFESLIAEYERLRQQEHELLKARLEADAKLQLLRFKVQNLTNTINAGMLDKPIMPCW